MMSACCILLATLILSLFALSSSFLPSKHITGWHRSKIQQIIPLLDQHRIRRIKLTPSLHVHGKESKQSQTSMIVDAACVGVGAVAGSLCRWQVGNIVTRKIAEEHPRWLGWHTAGINIAGSFILGSLAGLPTVDPAASMNHRGITARTRLMAGVGFCGSFTTFSTFSVDVVGMLGKGEMARAFSYMLLNNAGGVGAAFAGFSIARRLVGK